jgi:hypothetical protein
MCNMSLAATIIGTRGVVLILVSYFLLQLRKLSIHSFYNLVGSLMMLFSLYFQWNLPAVIIEIAWSFISIYGVFYALGEKNSKKLIEQILVAAERCVK